MCIHTLYGLLFAVVWQLSQIQKRYRSHFNTHTLSLHTIQSFKVPTATAWYRLCSSEKYMMKYEQPVVKLFRSLGSVYIYVTSNVCSESILIRCRVLRAIQLFRMHGLKFQLQYCIDMIPSF